MQFGFESKEKNGLKLLVKNWVMRPNPIKKDKSLPKSCCKKCHMV